MSNEKCKVGAGNPKACAECGRNREIDAIIIYPTLGAPQILPDNLKECTIIIVTDSTGHNMLLEDKKAAYLVNHHLRLIDFDDDKTKLPAPIDHRFYGQIDDDIYNTNERSLADTAQDYIVVKNLKFEKGLLYQLGATKEDDKFIGRLSTDAYDLYSEDGFTYFMSITLKQFDKCSYKLYSQIPKSWAWIVSTQPYHSFLNPNDPIIDPENECKPKEKPPVTGLRDCQKGNSRIPCVHQPLDRLIQNQLYLMAPDKGPLGNSIRGMLLDADALYEIPIEKTPLYEADYNKHGEKPCQRVQGWHPVMVLPNKLLALGHMTDTHISVRASSIARNPARVIEGEETFPPVGELVGHTFKSCKAIIDVVAEQGADALILTGDVIDYNRNIDPQHTKKLEEEAKSKNEKVVGTLWRALNCARNAHKPDGGYRRGMDHLYFYSLLMYALREWKLPAYYVAGNHEGYQMPYGISPRADTNVWNLGATAIGISGPGDKMYNYSADLYLASEAELDAWKEYQAIRTDSTKTAAEKKKAEETYKEAWKKYTEFNEATSEYASQYHKTKASENIPGDHNLTIFEACLAYGPTYGQLLMSVGFRYEQFDWLHWIYTPFSDLNFYPCCTDMMGEGAKQALTVMGWGTDERVLAPGLLNMVSKHLARDLVEHGHDRRGRGFLPYAKESIDEVQHKLLKAASEVKAEKWAVLTHFTIANFEDAVPATAAPGYAGFRPDDEPKSGLTSSEAVSQFNPYNWGGCEMGLKTYIEKYVSVEAAPAPGKVDMHICGHSHKAGIYTFKTNPKDKDAVLIDCRVPTFPGEIGQLPGVGAGTRFVVGGTSGPPSKQALSGWHLENGGWTDNKPRKKGSYQWNAFMGGWLLRPPLGMIIHTNTGELKCVTAPGWEKRNDRPRLAVGCDYRELISIQHKAHEYRPIVFCPPPEPAESRIFDESSLDNWGKSTETRFAQGLPVRLSKEFENLKCLKLEEMKVWVFKAGPGQEVSDENSRNNATTDSSTKGQWESIGAKVKKASSDYRLDFDDGGELLRSALTQKTNPSGELVKGVKEVLSAFMEIPLQTPTGRTDVPWDEMKCDGESWIFPVDIERDRYGNETLRRGEGESGEVPKWWFLSRYFGDIYPDIKDITSSEKPTESPGNKA